MTLALVCGTGDLPARIASVQEEKPFICVLDGFEPTGLQADLTFRLETLGSLLIRLGHEGVTQVCFCGAIERPQIDPTAIDADTRPLLPIIAEALTSGDDGALRAVIGLFEQTGFQILGAHELAPELVVAPGVLSEAWPDAQMRADAKLGASILNALSLFDVSQACIIGGGQLLGVETIAGTDALISGLPDVKQRAQGVLVKGPKIGQDNRVDMPTVGPETVRQVKNAGLRGIVVDAGDVIILDQEKTVELANEAGLVFWSRSGS